jgi:PAS domain-containing protein
LADEIDNVVPSYGYNLMPMVGLGGSAGATRALQAFFESVPADSGLAFVVILHLSPDHSSIMPEMVQRWTRMPTVAAENGQKVLVDHVYVIPPGKHLTATQGHLKLTQLAREQGRRNAVDLFFGSLADSYGPNAAAIVLSGADGDGMIGIRRIKERGGLTIAQDPTEAEQDSMPRMAMSTGLVDWVLPADAMPGKIIEYFTQARNRRLASDVGFPMTAALHLKLLERLAPPSIVVDRDYEVRHVSETAGRFLHVGGGVPSTNLLRMVKPELRLHLRALLLRAAQTGEPAVAFNLPLDLEGQDAHVTLEVAPAGDIGGSQGFLLVLFRRGTAQQHEASTEELRASNEELQAMNEELRSTIEELETSREELQSINEEMTAVNFELKSKVEELGRANSDLQNLMSATAIATVFLDRDLKVMRFTQPAAAIFNLISSDIGRPLSHLRPQIRYGRLAADAARVLQSLSPIEREVQGAGDACYLARMLPYRTLKDHIAGVVLTFVDITERQRAAAALLAQNEQLELFNQATIGRELRMVELKREINSLLQRLGEAPRYRTDPNEDGI